MKKTIVFLLMFVLILTSLFLSACAGAAEVITYESELAEAGLFGEHPVGQSVASTQLTGEVSGVYFIMAGAVEGSVSSSTVLSFSWSPEEGQFIPTDLPRTSFRIIVDETKDEPTVEFVFDEYWLGSRPLDPNTMLGGEGYHLPQSDLLNLNQFVQSEHLEVVLVRISAEDLEKESYLPK